MAGFWQYLTVQIVLTERKMSLITSLNPSIVKNNGKEGLNLSKVRRGKSLAQIFRKDSTETNLERTKMKKKKKMLSHTRNGGTWDSSVCIHKKQAVYLRH